MNKLLAILCSLLSIITIICIWQCCESRESNTVKFSEYVVDTLFIETEQKLIEVEKLPAKLKHTQDSSGGFRAEADTVISRDTILISYSYPENNFSFTAKLSRDSLIVEKISSFIPLTVEEAWWENPLYLLIGIIIGLLFGL